MLERCLRGKKGLVRLAKCSGNAIRNLVHCSAADHSSDLLEDCKNLSISQQSWAQGTERSHETPNVTQCQFETPKLVSE